MDIKVENDIYYGAMQHLTEIINKSSLPKVISETMLDF